MNERTTECQITDRMEKVFLFPNRQTTTTKNEATKQKCQQECHVIQQKVKRKTMSLYFFAWEKVALPKTYDQLNLNEANHAHFLLKITQYSISYSIYVLF